MPSTGASVVVVHSDYGGESRFNLPCRLRRVVLERSTASVGNQTVGGDTLGNSATSITVDFSLDFFDDEHRLS